MYMEGGGSEEKKLLCCFVVANERSYNFYALDFHKDSGEGDDQNYELSVGGGDQNCELGVGGDDQLSGLSDGGDWDDQMSPELSEGNDLKYRLFHDDIPDNMSHLPRLPDPFLTIPKIDWSNENGYPRLMAFGLLDGMLYMVSPGVEVYVFDTRDIITSSPAATLDHKVCVTRGPALTTDKGNPVVIPLAGKLFVSAKRFYPDRKGDTEHVIEVLDPENKYWSPIQLPERVFDFAEEKISKLRVSKTCLLLESHATVGSSIVLCWSLCCKSNDYELFVLDAETLSWKLRVDHSHMNDLFTGWGVCLFWDGIWCSQIAFTGMIMKEESMEGTLRVHLPSKEVSRTRGNVVRVDDTTLLVFSYAMKCQRYIEPCPDYFKLDMVRVDKRKRDKDGVEKLTANVVDSKEFFFKKYNPDFELAYCFSLSY